MRPSTAEGWYVLSIMSRSGDFAVKSPRRCALSTPHTRTDAATKSRVTSSPASPKVPTRSIILLAVAGFASQAMVRVTDSLLPQIAADFGTTVGEASIVVAAYAVSHGTIQLIIGPVGDRFGKYRTVTMMCALASILVALYGTVQSLSALAVARFASGAAAGWIIPLSMAYVGDVTPYERRQPVLARYLSGQIFGQLFGQAAGGVLGELFGWRGVFFRARGVVRARDFRPRVRASDQPAHPRGRPWRGNLARFRRRLCRRALQPVGAVRHSRRVHRSERRMGHLRLCRRRSAPALRAHLQRDRTDRRNVRDRRAPLRRLGSATGEPVRTSGARDLRRRALGPRLSHARLRRRLVAHPHRGHRHRARLLRAPQHAADQCHADDAAGAGHRGRDLLFGDLFRPDAGGGRGCVRVRPLHGGAAVHRDRRRAAGAGLVVRGKTATPHRGRPPARGHRQSVVGLASSAVWLQPRPRDTRSISARTRRSTMPGRFSSSQVLSIGRRSSLTTSSRVRPLRACAVRASASKAASTAAVVAAESRPRSSLTGRGASSVGAGSGAAAA